MQAHQALKFVDDLLLSKGRYRLIDVQRAVFLGSWEGKDYKEICRFYCSGRRLSYIKQDVGPNLWKLLTEVLGEPVTKPTLQGAVERAYQKYSETPHNFEEQPPPTSRPHTPIEPIYSPSTGSIKNEAQREGSPFQKVSVRQDWDGVPDVSTFQGRERELDELIQWLTFDTCRLLFIVGMAGVGKTYLSVQLAQLIRTPFECLIWRSLNHQPPLQQLLAELISFISNNQETEGNLPRLIHYLRNHSCLIVLDGFEAVLQSGVHDGSYLPGYEAYGELLRQLGEINHQSRVIITSREKPRQIANVEGGAKPVRSKELAGMGEQGSRKILATRGEGMFSGSDRDWRNLVSRCAGHPLTLNVVATQIWGVFNGQIAEFLEHMEQDSLISSDIRELFQQQFDRLSELEKIIIQGLASQPEPAEVEDILRLVPQAIPRAQLIDGLQSLRRRSLLEVESARYSLPPLMLEFMKLDW
jgi:hypothetical protein